MQTSNIRSCSQCTQHYDYVLLKPLWPNQNRTTSFGKGSLLFKVRSKQKALISAASTEGLATLWKFVHMITSLSDCAGLRGNARDYAGMRGNARDCAGMRWTARNELGMRRDCTEFVGMRRECGGTARNAWEWTRKMPLDNGRLWWQWALFFTTARFW